MARRSEDEQGPCNWLQSLISVFIMSVTQEQSEYGKYPFHKSNNLIFEI